MIQVVVTVWSPVHVQHNNNCTVWYCTQLQHTVLYSVVQYCDDFVMTNYCTKTYFKIANCQVQIS